MEELRKYAWFIDEKQKDLYLEIGAILSEIDILREYLEDLREAIACKPAQWQLFLTNIQKQADEVYSRLMYVLNSLLKLKENGSE